MKIRPEARRAFILMSLAALTISAFFGLVVIQGSLADKITAMVLLSILLMATPAILFLILAIGDEQ